MSPATPWPEATIIGFDTETTGKYPLAAEICEIAAVKWRAGKIIDTFQTLVKVSRPMSAEVIAIHHITDEMLTGAPSIADATRGFYKFIQDGYLVAHHAPFDLGFMAPEIEKLRLALPKDLVFCTSLFSRKAFPETENHRLQTLIKYFALEQGQAHRALDDAKACLEVALRCFAKVGPRASIEELLKYQEAVLAWSDYSVQDLRGHPAYSQVVLALEKNSMLQIVYQGGSKPGQARTVQPLGIVRNPLDDYLVAQEEKDEFPKRYFLKKISAARI